MKLDFILKTVLGIAAAFMVSSCNIDDDSNYYTPDTNVAYGIIANASPNSGDLFFYADENRINATASVYGTAEGYFRFYTGNRTLSLRDASGTLLDSTTVDLREGNVFSAFAVNTFNNIELVTYADTLVAPPAGYALVRFINLSPDAAPVNISAASQTLAEGVAFKEATDFISVAGGNYNFIFTNAETGQAIYSSTNVELYGDRIYTIYTKGFVTPTAGSNDTFTAEKIRNY
jgi:hypothetical protein